MGFLIAILLILAGILALSAFIVAKKPDAKAMIDKLVPFQAFIGIGLLAVCLYFWLIEAGVVNLFRMMKFWALGGLISIGAVFSGILLGFLFGMPQIAKWIPGESSAEQKAVELSKKVAPFQVLLGIIAVVSSLITMLYMFKILKVI